MKIAVALAAALLLLAPQARAQDCRAQVGNSLVNIPAGQVTIDCAVAGDLDRVIVRAPGRVCNAEPAAQKDALATKLGAWLNRELAQGASIKARAARIRGLLDGDPDTVTFLGRLLDAAQVEVRGLAADETVTLDYVLASREPVRLGFADCYPRAALLTYAESLRRALQSLLASLDGFWIKMPCSSQEQLGPAAHSVTWQIGGVTLDAVSPSQVLHYASPDYRAELCATQGAASYSWRVVSGPWELVGPVEGPKVFVRPNDQAVREARTSGQRLPDLALSLDVVFNAELPGLGAPRSHVIVGGVTRYGTVDAPPLPRLTRYWIEDYRLNTGQGTLENVGVVDRTLVLQADDRDGVIYIEGRGFPPDVRFRLADAEMQVLERSAEGDLRRFKAKTPSVTRAWIETASAADPVWLPLLTRQVKRLAPFYIQDELLRNSIGTVELGLGSPQIGMMQVRVGHSTSQSTLRQIEGSGVRLNVQDLRSQRHELSFSGGPGTNQVTIKVGIPFESAGEELVGSYEPTVVYWVCETVRVSKDQCSDGDLSCLMDAAGSAIDALPSCAIRRNWSEARVAASGGEASRRPLRGQIDSFRIDLEITLALDDTGKLKLDKYVAKSSGSYSLNTQASDLPQTPDQIQAMITNEVDGALNRNADLAAALQGMVDTLNATFATGFRIFGLSATSSVIFLDREGGP